MIGKSRSIIKRESIIGLPVINGKTGKKLGVIKDLYTKNRGTYLEGFYVTNNINRRFIAVPFDDATVGYDAVIAEGYTTKFYHEKAKDEVLEKLLNKKVVREDGAEIGVISDIIFDPLTGRIEGLELSESVIGDLISGRQILPYEPPEFIDGEALIISMEQAQNIIPMERGIKNIFLNNQE